MIHTYTWCLQYQLFNFQGEKLLDVGLSCSLVMTKTKTKIKAM